MKFLIAFAVLACSAAFSQSFVISTIAGRPVFQSVPALAATIVPNALAVDPNGNVYFVATNWASAFKLDSSGTVTRVAGVGASGFSGDGGSAPNAQLAGPVALAVDRAGSLYIAESAGRIRKVGPDGIITTIAGDGSCCFGKGDNGDGGPAAKARIHPLQLALDAAGNLYIGEPARVRKISTDGTITTVAGNGQPGYSGDGGPATSAMMDTPLGLSCDRTGNIYISDNVYGGDFDADVEAARVRKVSPDGIITTIAGNVFGASSGDGGPAINAQFFFTGPIATDDAGNVYVLDLGRVRKVSPDGIIATVAGIGQPGFSGDGGPALKAQFYGGALAADAGGNLYVADTGNNRVRKISTAGIMTTVAGNGQGCCYSGDGGPAIQAQLFVPTSIAIGASGAVYLADTFNNRLRRIDATGVITTIAGTGVPSPGSGDGGPSTRANLYWPTGLKLDGSGNLYFTDTGNMRICRISHGGVITTVAGVNGWPGYDGDGGPATAAHLGWPKDIAFDATGNLYIADTANHVIRRVSPAGEITTFAGTGGDVAGNGGFAGDGGPAASAHMNQPSGLAIDGAGNIYVADTKNFRVRRISAAGVITTVAGNGTKGYSGDGGAATAAQLTGAAGLAFDDAGNLYIGDGASVRMLALDGTISTVAGNGMVGFAGDGGPAMNAQTGAWGVAFDSAGRLYVADWWNNVIRLLTPMK